MHAIDTSTALCAVIGNPVAHSLSPRMHNAAFRAAGLNYVYLAFHVEQVEAFLSGVRAMPSFRGVSVTIPHKRAVMAHLDEIEPMARFVGSVNTITHEHGRLVGSTTDGRGALRALTESGVNLTGRRVLFLGSGGAVRAVAFAVAELTKAAHVTILGRTARHVEELVGDLHAAKLLRVSGGSLERDLRDAIASADIIIQGTSVGMEPNEGESCVPQELFCPGQVVFDMIYRPHETRLLREARAAGCAIVHGIDMLLYQAALQFERWTGVLCPMDAMRQSVADLAG
ncbi:MAG: shikimate dehydrogenase [Candidatus Hydrogenedentes bacterium]|nr:shikimate dehydrogenase [Candidatus Hydrogenedentota bacterium]